MLSLRPASQRGLSIIELMVAVGILGLLMVTVTPTIGEWMRNLAVRNAGESMKAGLERARNEALRRNTPISFWLVSGGVETALDSGCALSSTGPSWVVAGADPSGACDAAASNTVLPLLVDRWAASDGARRISVSGTDAGGAGASQVQFNSLGQLTAAGNQLARIQLSHTGGDVRLLEIRIDTGGRVRLCDPAVGAGDPRACL